MSLRSATALLIFILGLIIGANMPDFDRQFSPLLRHRSIITHSWLIPGVLLLWARIARNRDDWHALIAGLCIGIAVHLSFDLFPRNWYGYALITFPLISQRTDGTFSWLWIASSIVICLVIAATLTPKDQRSILTLAALSAFIWCVPGEQGVLGAALFLGLALVLLLHSPGWLLRWRTGSTTP